MNYKILMYFAQIKELCGCEFFISRMSWFENKQTEMKNGHPVCNGFVCKVDSS